METWIARSISLLISLLKTLKNPVGPAMSASVGHKKSVSYVDAVTLRSEEACVIYLALGSNTST